MLVACIHQALLDSVEPQQVHIVHYLIVSPRFPVYADVGQGALLRILYREKTGHVTDSDNTLLHPLLEPNEYPPSPNKSF